MPDPVDLSAVFGLPPEKAIEYFQSKGYALTWGWQDMWQEAHAKAFTVAKVMNTDILNNIRGALDEALNNGSTFRDFEKKLTPILQAKGWWGKTEHVNTLTGEISPAQLGSPRRLKTIYQTNLQTAYMAGRYRSMMENVGTHPYWQYVAVMDGRTRPTHRAMNGRIFRYDDPLWSAMYPPNGFNCRCRVSAVSEFEVRRDGLVVESSGDRLIDHEIRMKNGDTAQVKALRIKVDGQDKLFAPDAGWSYNPGKMGAWQSNMAATITKKTHDMPAMMRNSVLGAHEVKPVAADFRQAVNQTLTKIPEHVRAAVMAAGFELRIAPCLTDILPRLKGVHPRGHRPGVTWDHLDGGVFGKDRVIALASTALDLSGASIATGIVRAAQLLRHEYGHAWDMISGLSDSKIFITTYEKDAVALNIWLKRPAALPFEASEQLAYLLQVGQGGRQEACAEIFAGLLGGGTATYIDAMQAFPMTSAVVKSVLEQAK